MIFVPTLLPGAFVIELQRIDDERGCFARTWCGQEFQKHGIDPTILQCSLSFNHKAGTLRGMHWQAHPHEEIKLVRCTMGALHDVIVDLRKDSPTYLRHIGVELTAQNRKMLLVPKGFGHGYITMRDETEVFYQMSESYHPECVRGARWNDSAFGIEWPAEVRVIHERDRTYPDFKR